MLQHNWNVLQRIEVFYKSFTFVEQESVQFDFFFHFFRVLEAQCCPVTDNGIRGLCVSVDDLGEANPGHGQCKSIHTLDIYGTKVTIKGVQLALENLSDLKDFNFE